MAEIALPIDPLKIALLATPLPTLNLAQFPALAKCLSHTTFLYVYELARKTPAELKAWNFTGEAVKQANALLRTLDLELSLTLTRESILAVQEATYKHGTPGRVTRTPALATRAYYR